MASRINHAMRWVCAAVAGVVLAAASGCTRPNDEFPSTYLAHRNVSTGEPDDDPDGGTLPIYPVTRPDPPGQPVE